MEAFRKGGKVKKKKVMKQKQRQNVKQSVVVKINNGGGKRRAYAPRVARPQVQPYVNVYTPQVTDQNAYKELRDQLKELQKEKESKIAQAQEAPVVGGTQPIQNVRERQQREYEQVVNNPDAPVEASEVLRPRTRASRTPRIDSSSYLNQLIEAHNNPPVKPPKTPKPPATPVATYQQEIRGAHEATPHVTAYRGGGARAQPTDTETEVVKRGRGRPRGSTNKPKETVVEPTSRSTRSSGSSNINEGIPPEPKAKRNRKFKIKDAPMEEYY